MSLTAVQIDPFFQKALGRNATDYEASQYANTSTGELPNIAASYNSLNKNNSIVDYLKYTGQDPSIKNMQTLAAKYGIQNIGTAAGNTALLKALQNGTTPAPVTPNGQQGTVTTAAATAPVAPTPAPQGGSAIPAGSINGVDANGNPVPAATSTTPLSPLISTNPSGTPVNGSIATAGASTSAQDTSSGTSATYTPDPALAQAYNQYTSIQSQIAQIDSATSSALANKIQQVEQAGGVVNEAQLMGEVQAENAPLLAQRKELVYQQGILGKTYQGLLTVDRQNRADFNSAQTRDQNQEKINNQASQFTQKESDVAAKYQQAGWKPEKVNITDSAGNVLGQQVIWTQDPANAPVDNEHSTVKTTSGSGGISKTGVTNTGNVTATTPPKLTIADGATPGAVLNSLITGPAVVFKGSTTPVSQQTLYNLAIDDMLGVSSSGIGGMGSAGLRSAVQGKETDILNAYGLTPFDVASAKAEMTGMTSANTALLGTEAFINTYADNANKSLALALSASADVSRTGSKLVNNYAQWASGNFTPAGPLATFETYIYTAAREYAKVTSGGAKSASGLTDSATSAAENLISASQSPEAFAATVAAMQADMKNVTSSFATQTSSFPDAVKALYGLASGGSTSSTTGSGTSTGSAQAAATAAGYDYNAMIQAGYTDADIRAAIASSTQQ